MEPNYRICVFGNTDGFGCWRSQLENALNEHLKEFKMKMGKDVSLQIGKGKRDNLRISTVGIFWGGKPLSSYEWPENLESYHPIIPIVSKDEECGSELPEQISVFGAIQTDQEQPEVKIAAAIMESLGILPDRRRVFLSYRRDDHPEVALQLYHKLREKQFNVFLDTLEIRPGTNFQEFLMHQLSDSDIMIMLDTKGYYNSKWTQKELSGANNLHIEVFRIEFPESSEEGRKLSFTKLELKPLNFNSDNRTLNDDVIESIYLKIEMLRSVSVANRIRNLKNAVSRVVAANKHEIQFQSSDYKKIQLKYTDNSSESIYPTTIVPNAELLFKITNETTSGKFAIIYEDAHISKNWSDFLEWVGSNVEDFRWLKMSDLRLKLRRQQNV